MTDAVNVEEIKSILELLRDEEIDYFHIRTASTEIIFSSDATNQPTANAFGVPGAPTTNHGATVATPPAQATSVATTTRPATAPAPVAADGRRAIKAPMIGTFYRAPDPESPPFVEVGTEVSPDTTIGLIEAMKVFTAVRAGEAGRIEAIVVENATFVEYDQPLVYLADD